MIEVRNLSKNYGKIKAVDNVSFKVEKGEIVGFLGPNGAGKTTTMNIITGYIAATDGQAFVDGFDVSRDPMEVKKRIGYLPEHPPIYLDMTVKEYLGFVAELNRMDRDKYTKQIKDISDIVKISDVYTRLCKNLSKGYRQRVGLAAALIGNPEVLILDEPTVGLDPIQIIDIRRLIKELGKDHTIILSSHILPEVSAVCERVIIINQGRIVAEDTPEKLSSALNAAYKFTITAEGDYEQIEGIIKTIDGIKEIFLKAKDKKTVEVIIESFQHLDVRRDVFFKLARNGIPILEMKLNQMTLEDIFLKVTMTEEGGAE
jgi:ABC-2 type transport system ATP-binding protein